MFTPLEVFARITGVRKLFGRRQGISRCWMLSMPYVLISKPECVEVNLAKIFSCLFFCVVNGAVKKIFVCEFC